MMKRMYVYLILMITVPLTALSFDYDLDFFGIEPPNLKTMGCKCETQEQFQQFYGEYSRDIARFSHYKLGLETGILRSGTANWLAKGFLSTYTALNLNDYLDTMGEPRDWEGFVVFVGWPEFGGTR